jgi:hypothetical protein
MKRCSTRTCNCAIDGASDSMHDAVSNALMDAARGWNGEEPSAGLRKATGVFIARATQDPSVLGRIAPSLAELEPGAAAWIALACGTAIEGGADPALSGKPVVDLLSSWLSRLPPAEGQRTSELPASQNPFEYLCQSVVSHLARLPALREQLGHDLALIERLDKAGLHSFGPIWVREALLKSSGSLLLIHPTSATGLRIRYSNVSNCFHLFSLIQIAVGQRLEGGRVPNDAVARVAKGDSAADITDEAWWHYGDAYSSKADVSHSIWGEHLTREIPVFEGEQVILAWPHVLARRIWDANFMRPHLDAMPADAVLEGELSAEEVAAWMKRLGIAPAKRRWPWSRR